MSKLIAISAGHGPNTPGKRTPPIPSLGGRVIKEFEFNNPVAKMLEKELKRCGFRTLMVYDEYRDTPLSVRTNRANNAKADAYISIHFNAYDGVFNNYDPDGHSLHVYPGARDSRKLAECILKHLKGGTPQRNRGIVEQNLHETRETRMTAVLSENGFMDNKREAKLMSDKDFQKEVAVEHAKGICDYYGVKYIPEPEPVKKEVQKAVAKEPTQWEIELAEAIKFVQDNKISDGLRPEDQLTRGQMFVILHRLSKEGRL